MPTSAGKYQGAFGAGSLGVIKADLKHSTRNREK